MLRDVSLHVRRGEVAALLGPNGAGKTTCFYAIAGLIPPDRGTITVDAQDVTWLPMYRRAKMGIGYLPQEASVFRGMTVANNIRAILEITVRDADKRNAMLDELLGEFSITHLRRAPAISLSGGERRRVEIARCLAAQPKYVLLDEPFAGVDPLAVSDIRALVRHLKDRGIGVLITDHNVRETSGNRRPSLYPPRRRRPDDRDARGGGSGRQCSTGLPRRQLPDLTPSRPGARLMALSPRIEIRQQQALVMTPQLQQAIKLLQMSHLELSAFVAAEIEKNPLLELAPPPAPGRRRSARPERRRGRRLPRIVAAQVSLHGYLRAQIGAMRSHPAAIAGRADPRRRTRGRRLPARAARRGRDAPRARG